MGDVVKGKFAILYAKLGSVYYPMACTKDVSLEITSETIELAPRSSKDFREYEYGRKTGRITGSGLTKVSTTSENLYNIFDLIGYQLQNTKALMKFSLTDGTTTKVLECNTIIDNTTIDKVAGTSVGDSYSLTITGPITISTTPVATGGDVQIYTYGATGTISSLEILDIASTDTVLLVYINGVSFPVRLAPDGYDTDEVQWNASEQKMYFGTSLVSGDVLRIIYIG